MESLNKHLIGKSTISIVQFDMNVELSKHAWRPGMGHHSAKLALKGKSMYTYLLRKGAIRNKFEISFVDRDGLIQQDVFTLIDSKYGIWRNGHTSHLGKLHKVIRDMMDCAMHEGQPLE
ncbi:MAG: hypothetical protein K1000chlam2_00541 [Chlamydiae bacterium]|nr:hypothetical protein [Chlamydiota bacterium]